MELGSPCEGNYSACPVLPVRGAPRRRILVLVITYYYYFYYYTRYVVEYCHSALDRGTIATRGVTRECKTLTLTSDFYDY